MNNISRALNMHYLYKLFMQQILHSMLGSITRKSRRTIMQTSPSTASHSLVSPMCSKIFRQTSRNLPPLMLMPRISFTWLVAMIMAAADVKPTETGPDIKSIKNPGRKCLGLGIEIFFNGRVGSSRSATHLWLTYRTG